ncbi:phosphotriesterase family protein [Streptomonospora nanhaiensis]|uniref:phosphotriesterase family protein n=1 Tax=Streptomonospora nanhaiensis TaxID=1323731 RepID=UPI001C382C97|nr:aryldialkylphosphatase [Streptomonospora nanhaiensis]MBV2364538.1 aryldialkylphosphatase [Streptomonospora nanhaiensis]
MMIRTVTGQRTAPAGVAGAVLAHEHLRIDLTTPADPAAAVTDDAAVVAELRAARAEHGLGLVVDLTCRGMGRDVRAVRSISERSGVPVVVATGWYYERFHPGGEPGGSVERAADLLVAEIEEGVAGTGIRPGVIGEVGSHGPAATPAERTGLLAAGRAAAATGLPVATHAHLGQGALEQLDLLTGAGVPPHRVSIGHQDLAEDPGQHRAIAEAGAYVAFDTVGKASYRSDEHRLALLLDLLEAGHARRVLLSNDISRDAYLASRGGQGFGHVLGPFRRALAERGVDEPTLDLLYRANALRWLTGTEES